MEKQRADQSVIRIISIWSINIKGVNQIEETTEY